MYPPESITGRVLEKEVEEVMVVEEKVVEEGCGRSESWCHSLLGEGPSAEHMLS